MPTPQEKLDQMLKDFETANDTKAEHPGKNLRDLLDKSPDLKARILDSIDKGHLEHFAALPAGANAGGTYNSGNKTIELPMGYLKTADTNASAAAELVFVMGHEIQHSFNSSASDVAVDGFKKEVEKIAKGPGPHDYTKAVGDFIDNFRKDEAGAHIGGFNAIASQVMKDNPKAGLKELYNAHPSRMGDFIERTGTAPTFAYALKAGLTLNADNTLTASKENVEAMGKHYFDQPPASARLGAKGNQDYPNYYGEWAMNQIARTEKKVQDAAKLADPKHVAPGIQIDTSKIGLDPKLIDTTLTYTDTSPKKAPIDVPSDPATPGPQKTETPKAESVTAPTTASPERPAMFNQAVAALEKLGPDAGLRDRGERDTVAAAMAVKAQGDGLSQIDTVVRSSNGNGLIAIQGNDPTSELARRSFVDRNEALQQSLEQNLGQLAQQQAQRAQDTQQQAPRAQQM